MYDIRYFLQMNFEKKNDLVCIEIKIMDLNSDIFEIFFKKERIK